MIVSSEIEPGNHLPTHRDSTEELLVVTAGGVEPSNALPVVPFPPSPSTGGGTLVGGKYG